MMLRRSASTARDAIGLVATGGVGLALLAGSISVTAAAPNLRGVAARELSGSAGAAQSSASWSGYVATSRLPLTYVTAAWMVPAVSCVSTTLQAAAEWVGFDGWYDKTVEQGGTEAYCSGRTPQYSAWWEMYPTNQMAQLFPVRPGDSISASVTYRTGLFTIAVRDLTSGRSSVLVERCASTVTCSRSSAEWIAEAPAYGGHRAGLAHWNGLRFSEALTSSSITPGTGSDISAFANFKVEMSGTHGAMAQPSALIDGRGFNDSWISST
jgi:hypothetical protein